MSIPLNTAGWEQFVELARCHDDEIDLAAAAFLIAATEYPQLDIAHELGVLDSLSAGAAKRFSEEPEPLYCLNTLSEYLFDEVGFRGNPDDYYDPRNSFLNEVLSRRLGIPITLSLVCIEVGKRLDIPLLGVGMPGHFLLRHRDDESLFIDPFHGGILLSEEECAQRMKQATPGQRRLGLTVLVPIEQPGVRGPVAAQPEGHLLAKPGLPAGPQHDRAAGGPPSGLGPGKTGPWADALPVGTTPASHRRPGVLPGFQAPWRRRRGRTATGKAAKGILLEPRPRGRITGSRRKLPSANMHSRQSTRMFDDAGLASGDGSASAPLIHRPQPCRVTCCLFRCYSC